MQAACTRAPLLTFITAGSSLLRIVIFVGLSHYGLDSSLAVVLFVGLSHYGLDSCLTVVQRSSACQNAASVDFHFGNIVCLHFGCQPFNTAPAYPLHVQQDRFKCGLQCTNTRTGELCGRVIVKYTRDQLVAVKPARLIPDLTSCRTETGIGLIYHENSPGKAEGENKNKYKSSCLSSMSRTNTHH